MPQIFISLGTNIDREFYVEKGLNALAEQFGQLTLSSLFESEAVGFSGSPFFNMVIGAQTTKKLEEISVLLREIEFANGREPNAQKYSPRTLDLDLLLYDDIIAKIPAQIPREEIVHNAFVLWPLAEIAGELMHPVLQVSYQQLWHDYDKNRQVLNKVPLSWQNSHSNNN